MAAPIVERLISQARDGLAPHLAADECELWDLFFSVQWRRVPELHRRHMSDEAFARSIDEIVEEFERDYRPMTSQERDFVESAKLDADIRHNTAIRAIRVHSGIVTDALRQRGLLLAMPSRRSKSFVLGSSPIVRMGGPPGATLEHPELETWITLAPDVAFTYYGAAGAAQMSRLPDSDVRRLNRLICAQSRFVIARDRQILVSLLQPS